MPASLSASSTPLSAPIKNRYVFTIMATAYLPHDMKRFFVCVNIIYLKISRKQDTLQLPLSTVIVIPLNIFTIAFSQVFITCEIHENFVPQKFTIIFRLYVLKSGVLTKVESLTLENVSKHSLVMVTHFL